MNEAEIEPRAVELVAERPEFLVVAKPAHLLSHPTRPDGRPTLLGKLQSRYPGEFLALVNRLDRETSGLILVARSAQTASRFGAMTMARQIEKEYLAMVAGRVSAATGQIEAPLARLGISPTNPIWLRQGVVAANDVDRPGAAARTEFWRLAMGEAATLLRVRAHTGRLHQLRVHLAHLGHPVLGDKIYGPDPQLYLRFIAEGWTAEHAERLPLARHALHAATLRFSWHGQPEFFRAPLPEDMLALAGRMGIAVPAETLRTEAPAFAARQTVPVAG